MLCSLTHKYARTQHLLPRINAGACVELCKMATFTIHQCSCMLKRADGPAVCVFGRYRGITEGGCEACIHREHSSSQLTTEYITITIYSMHKPPHRRRMAHMSWLRVILRILFLFLLGYIENNAICGYIENSYSCKSSFLVKIAEVL